MMELDKMLRESLKKDLDTPDRVNNILLKKANERADKFDCCRKNNFTIVVAGCAVMMIALFSIDLFTNGALADGIKNIYNKFTGVATKNGLQKYGDELYTGNEEIVAGEDDDGTYWEFGFNEDTGAYVIKLDFVDSSMKATYMFREGFSDEDKVWSVRTSVYECLNELIKSNQVTSEAAVEKLEAIEGEVKFEYIKDGIKMAIEDIKSGENLVIFCETIMDEENTTEDRLVIKGYSWYLVNCNELRFENGNEVATIEAESVAGIEKSCVIQVKKTYNGITYVYEVLNSPYITNQQIQEFLNSK